MLKQMIENWMEVKIVSWDTEDLYRKALNLCVENNYSSLTKYLISLSDFKKEYEGFFGIYKKLRKVTLNFFSLHDQSKSK